MRVVVADATPIPYLILVDAIDLLARLFEKIHIPVEVRDGLMREAAPKSVRTWIASPPTWVQIHTDSCEAPEGVALLPLDLGERAAIALAESIRADLLLIVHPP